jgi:hypothetical protein
MAGERDVQERTRIEYEHDEGGMIKILGKCMENKTNENNHRRSGGTNYPQELEG